MNWEWALTREGAVEHGAVDEDSLAVCDDEPFRTGVEDLLNLRFSTLEIIASDEAYVPYESSKGFSCSRLTGLVALESS